MTCSSAVLSSQPWRKWDSVTEFMMTPSAFFLSVRLVSFDRFYVIRFYCVFEKRITLCNCLCSASSRLSHFSASGSRDLGFVNRYSWFWKFLNMVDRVGESSFFRGLHVRSDIRIDISVSIKFMTTNLLLGKQVHLRELTKLRLIKKILMTSSRQDHVTNKNHYISTTTMTMVTKIDRRSFLWKKLTPKIC